MLNSTLFLSSLSELQTLLLHQLTIFHIAVFYVLTYVVYKALGRYIYFKPQEHASKINRTFLVISIFVVVINAISGFTVYLPILQEYRWLYVMSGLVLLFAPLSIITSRLIWKYDRWGYKNSRGWHYDYLQIPTDYYKTAISKTTQSGNTSHTSEEEGVESTSKNIHSDALLNLSALMIFIVVSIYWAHLSSMNYGWTSYVFSTVITLTIGGIFLNNAIFSWIKYLHQKFVRME